MAKTNSTSLIVIGAGIVGLCIAVVAQVRGHAVTIVARDKAEDTASGVAAGMIAPVLESRTDPWNPVGLARMRRAQDAWLNLTDAWPRTLTLALRQQQDRARSVFIWRGDQTEDDDDFLGFALQTARSDALDISALQDLHVSPAYSGEPVPGDWLIDATATLSELESVFRARGGQWLDAEAISVASHTVRLDDGATLTADHVVLAAGFGTVAFADAIPLLERLHPIKGHILDLSADTPAGVIRAAEGYLASYGGSAKFGASMEAGRDDLAVDSAVVADLKARAATMFPDLDLSPAVPRTGIRAATPDGWPIIGRDPTSGVYIATGMRRNGYVFAPLAAQIVVDLIEGVANPDAHLYRPDRF